MKIFSKQVKYIYEQEKDCCDGESSYDQELIVETQDGGGGYFLVLKTDRWALDLKDIDALCEELKRVLNKVNEPEGDSTLTRAPGDEE